MFDKLLTRGVSSPISDALVRIDRATTLVELGRPDEALAGYDELLARHDPGALPPGDELFIVAFSASFERAQVLVELGHFSEAMAGFDQLIELHTRHPTGDLLDTLWDAKIRRATVLGALGRPEHALTAFREVLEHPHGVFDRGPEREHVIVAAANTAMLLTEIGRPFQALETYDWLLTEHGGEAPVEHWQIALARSFRAELLTGLDRPDEALAGYDELLTRHHDALTTRASYTSQIDAQRRWVVLQAALARADLLAQLNRPEQALTAYTTISDIYTGASTDWLREITATALRRGSHLLEDLGRHREALDALDRADELTLLS